MYNKLQSVYQILKDKLYTREIITYGISGVLTTAINLISYYLCWNIFGIHNLVANIIAWLIAVTFAYFMNAVWVFKDERQAAPQETIKMFKFYAARVFSLIVEETGLFIFVELLHFNNMIVKCGLAVIVIVLNYVLSKLFIFNKKSSK